ncbi:DUF89 family protein [Candidatus Fermentibacterales bacterium]|nr:DUF89 family protein [Candidatus Fermentibacterales bacterium]
MPLRPGAECTECFREGLASFIRTAGTTGKTARALLSEAMAMVLPRLGHHPPPVAGAPVYAWLRERLGRLDIFEQQKKSATEEMMMRADSLRAAYASTADPPRAALRACCWANLIDVAQGRELPEAEILMETLSRPLAIDETERFLEQLSGAGSLLVLGDNAGETVLDMLFLEQLAGGGCELAYAVRPLPVLNDATSSDAEAAGLGRVARLVSTGLDAPTVVPSACSPGFAELLRGADLVLSKGQGNLEGLILGNGEIDPHRIYYSFVVKCDVIADLVSQPRWSGIFASGASLEAIAGRRESRASCPSTSTSASTATGYSSSS